MSQKEPNEDKERIEKNSEQKYDGCFLTVFFRNLMKVKKNISGIKCGMNVSFVWKSAFETV